jgi:hypothetical protein
MIYSINPIVQTNTPTHHAIAHMNTPEWRTHSAAHLNVTKRCPAKQKTSLREFVSRDIWKRQFVNFRVE